MQDSKATKKGSQVKKTFAVILGAMIGTALVLGACSDDDPSEEEATSAYCSDLAALGSTTVPGRLSEG